MKKHFSLFVLILVILSACSSNKTTTDKDSDVVTSNDTLLDNTVNLTNEQLKSANISIGIPVLTSMHKVIKVNGLIDVPPSNILSMSIPMGGYLKNTNLIPGMSVRKGSLMAILEDPSYVQLQQDYLISKSKLEYLESDFNRQKELNATKATSDKVFQLAKSDFESQRYLVKSFSEKLKLIGVDPLLLNENTISRSIKLLSPINGFITKVNVNMGKYITPTDVLFEIIDPSDLHLRLIVFENDATNLRVGDKVSFFTNNNTSKKYFAKVAVITPNINEERTTEVHCHLINENVNLYPGTYANAEIELNDAKVNAVPEEAIVKWENKNFLFQKLSNNSFKLVAVETGMNTNGWVEIKPLQGNQEFVFKNAYTLLMKLKNSGE